jgi:hypothetical protein
MDSEFYRQFLGSVLRHFIVMVGGSVLAGLVAKGLLTEEQVATLLDEKTVGVLVGVLLVGGGLAWSWMKIKFNLNFVGAAIKAEPGTPVAEIKQAALSKETTQTSV